MPLRHLAALALFVALAVWSTYPLVHDPGRLIPGSGPMDNVTFLWNTWWIEEARTSGVPVFRSPMLFAPFGTQLVLHSHTVLQGWLAQGLRPFASLPAAQNVVLLFGLAANGVAAYALAFRYVRQVLPSLAAGVLFAASAFVQLRVLGHFNLAHAWVIPTYVLALAVFVAQPSIVRAVALAAAAAVVTYADYYYTLYCAALTVVWLASMFLGIEIARRPRPFRVMGLLFLVLLVVDALLIAIVLVTGGTTIDVGNTSISIRSIRNPLTVFWVALAGCAAAWIAPRISIHRIHRERPSIAHCLVAAGVYFLFVWPIVSASLELVRTGEYVTQPVRWRSSPPGVDLATAVLGNPRHIATGTITQSIYRRLGIDVMEQAAWCGVLPFAVLIAHRRAWLGSPDGRMWLAAGALFLVVALGPFLRFAGTDTALPLPFAVLRYVPLVSHARIPGRAMVMVQLAAAVLTAMALARRTGDGVSSRVRWALVALLAVESVPSPAPVYALPQPDAVDGRLRADPVKGAVAEVPLGLRDGFGETGLLDHRALVHQTAHGRPLAGGFVARLAPTVRAKILASPLLVCLLEASTPGTTAAPLPADAAAQAAALGIRYLVINRDTLQSSDALTRSKLEAAGFRFVEADGPRELFAVP